MVKNKLVYLFVYIHNPLLGSSSIPSSGNFSFACSAIKTVSSSNKSFKLLT